MTIRTDTDPDDDVHLTLPVPHAKQAAFVYHPAKRKVVRAGRRSGKTKGLGIYGMERFFLNRRVLYAAPTADQLGRFWSEVTAALGPAIDAGVFRKNETSHTIELPGTEVRIKAKTAWNADTLRGDYADDLILDEWQLMDETCWDEVGAPMLLDTDGDAVFSYTPPSLRSRSATKARDPQHAPKLWAKAKAEQLKGNLRWAAFHFTSMDNPFLSVDALAEIASDMSALAYRQEILAQDINEAPGAMWKRKDLDATRVPLAPKELERIVIGVDPTASSEGDAAGIVGTGSKGDDYFALADATIQGSPMVWAGEAVALYHELDADCIVAESNNGGEMVQAVIHQVDSSVPVRLVWATRGKAIRAEPASILWEQGRGHIVGSLPHLENELALWEPGVGKSPNRLDAMVWGITELLRKTTRKAKHIGR